MPLDDAIRAAAERNGVQQEFWDIYGQPHITASETNRAILTALGFDCSSEQSLTGSIASLEERERSRLLPPVLVVTAGEPIRFAVNAPSNSGHLELGVSFDSGELGSFSAPVTDGIVELPGTLPLGYHEIHASGVTMRLIVTPTSARRAEAGKRAGLGITLYGIRSARNWGCGDFRDLGELIDWAVPALHVDFIALNPLHAIHNRTPYNTSPYLPNSIFYRNFLYLDVEAVPGYEKIRGAFETTETRAAMERLRESGVVEYEAVAALKRRALELIFNSAPPNAACRNWIAGEGELLRLYATYCALDTHLHAADESLWVWPDWPERFRDPAHPAVAEFARTHERELLYYGWLQWLIDQQLAALQRRARAAGMGIGLYHDLALATDRFGSDLWAHRAFFINGARVGSPPDGFSPAGQDWSFPPPHQQRHMEDGYCLFRESIRKSMRHGGALRIDHVMRLFRLYWIPEAHTAAQGAYVRDRPSDLVRILALESVRNDCVIIGEDLGTVETEVRETLARFGILSYRLLIFEQDTEGFKPPYEYPEQALVSTTTHDLPTMAGFWTGQDIAARLDTGIIDRDAFDAQREDRIRDKQRLLDALFAMDLLPPGYERHAALIPALTPELHYAILGFLASTPAALWLVNQEDLTGETLQQNLPGTTAEHPNWSRKMQWSLEDLRDLAEARECAQMVRIWVERSGRYHPEIQPGLRA
ncbi:MAG: 4-alpha-glucanotransferase [Acidobacteriota bacterium]